jgi:transcriptional regulator with XRE-family HTH domain
MQLFRQPAATATFSFNPVSKFHGIDFSVSLNRTQEEFSVSDIYGNTKKSDHVRMDTKSIRLENLRQLIEKEPSKSAFAERVDTSAAYLSQIFNTSHPANVGAALARKIEQKLGLPHGWMDSNHSVSTEQESESSGYTGSEIIQPIIHQLIRMDSQNRISRRDAAHISALLSAMDESNQTTTETKQTTSKPRGPQLDADGKVIMGNAPGVDDKLRSMTGQNAQNTQKKAG